MKSRIADQIMTAKQAAAVAFIVPAIATILTVLLKKCDTWSIFLYAVVYFCFIPLIMFGVYVMATGNGAEWMNMGINWRNVNKEKERDCVSYMGIYMIIGCIIMMFGMAMVFLNIIVLLVMIAAGTLILFIPIIRIKSKDGVSKIPKKTHIHEKRDMEFNGHHAYCRHYPFWNYFVRKQ